MFEFSRELTPHGVIVASDREHDRVFTVRWSGAEREALRSSRVWPLIGAHVAGSFAKR